MSQAEIVLNNVQMLNLANIIYMVLVIFIPPVFKYFQWDQSFGTATYLLLLFALSAYAFKCVQELHQKLESVDAEEDNKAQELEELTKELKELQDKFKDTKLQNTILIEANDEQHQSLGELSAKIRELTAKNNSLTAKSEGVNAKAKKWEKISEFLDVPIFHKNNRYYKYIFSAEGLEKIQCNAQGVAMSIVA